MRKLHILLLGLLSIVLFSCKKDSEAEPTPQPQPDPKPSPTPVPDMPDQLGSGEVDGYQLVWQDLFDDAALNTNYWNIEVNNNPSNNELQAYTAKNVSLELDSTTGRHCLVLTAQKEEFSTSRHCTSGRVNTKNKVYYKHGKVEAMIKLPKTYKGLWPAFWMMGNDYPTVGWPACGELDIFEMGHKNGFQTQDKSERYLNGATHCAPQGKWNEDNCQSQSTTYQYSLQDGYHLFTLLWTEESINCYIDLDRNPEAEPYFSLNISAQGKTVHTDYSCWDVHCYFHKEFFVILNLAVGGDFPGIKDVNGITAFNADNGYKAKMYIDYVRIYQK